MQFLCHQIPMGWKESENFMMARMENFILNPLFNIHYLFFFLSLSFYLTDLRLFNKWIWESVECQQQQICFFMVSHLTLFINSLPTIIILYIFCSCDVWLICCWKCEVYNLHYNTSDNIHMNFLSQQR